MKPEGVKRREIDLGARRLLVYLAAAALLFLLAGCAGWQSGPSFKDEFDPQDKSPVTAVKKWFKSMEWIEGEDGKRNPDKGRDFSYYLEVLPPEFLRDMNGQFIGADQLKSLQEKWNSREWEVEFSQVQLEEGEVLEGREATVRIVGGSIRYIGKEMFGTVEYKTDSFGDKEGEIYLRWYEDPQNDPLIYVNELEDFKGRFAEVAGKGRWVVVGGLDLSENEGWSVGQ